MIHLQACSMIFHKYSVSQLLGYRSLFGTFEEGFFSGSSPYMSKALTKLLKRGKELPVG